MIPVKLQYTDDSIEKLLWQYRDSSNLQGLLQSLTDQLLLVQDDAFEIVENFSVEDAEGYLLDLVGKLVGENRNGRDDDEFRGGIILKTLLNTSNGTPNRILESLALATNATRVRLWEHYPLGITYYTNGDRQIPNLSEAIKSISPVTVSTVIIFVDPENDSFTPAEIDVQDAILIDHEQNVFVTQDFDEILVKNLVPDTGLDEELTWLSEYTYGIPNGTESGIEDGYGILAEINMA